LDATREKASESCDGAQKANLDKFKNDITSIESGSEVTSEMKTQLRDDICSTLQTANKPSEESVQKFATDMTSYVADKKLSPREAAMLTSDINAILNSANISAEEVDALKDDAMAIVDAANISEDEKQTMKDDIASITATSGENVSEVKQVVSEIEKTAPADSGQKKATLKEKLKSKLRK
jgi:hypothetical protein